MGEDCWLAYHDKFKGLPIVGQGGPNATPDPSAILTAKPQVIIEDQLYAQVMDPNQLQEETKIPVIVVYTFLLNVLENLALTRLNLQCHCSENY